VRDEVVEQLGVDVERVRVVPYGVDGPGQIASVRPPTSPPSIHSLERGRRSAPYVLALGAVEPRKNLPTLVRAFAELAPTHEDLELVVAGPGGWGETAFQAAVAACGVAGRVVRLGYLQEEDRLALLSGAVALAYPSLYEGFGFPPLEAMAAGVPVVASSAGSLPEVLGDAAELVAAGDDMALADALARVIDDAGLRSRLIEAGRVRAASFTWASAAASIVELYRVAAHEKQARSC
jgi:glycosyltransferase involved in cell wall biosynthesis